jgi:pyruvate formate lyase activating enzyme
MKPAAIDAVAQCTLCPKQCRIAPGQSGECRIRVNRDGMLCAVTYGYPSAIHVDPIEKKPLNHFLPGTTALSIATVGCNLHCKNCQNWELSQCNPEDAEAVLLPPQEVVRTAREQGCPSIAYTYSDPVVWYEYALDCCIAARAAGLRNVLVTAGYLNDKPWRELCKHTDAANIDLKGITEKFYREVCGATLKPVQEALVSAKSLGVEVEVTYLLIPTLNDSDQDIGDWCAWVVGNLGRETPVHISRFFPQYKMRHLPPTPPETLDRARQHAVAAGLDYVYVGNILARDGANTYCPNCRRLLIGRTGYRINAMRVTADGHCPDCKQEIYGVWK